MIDLQICDVFDFFNSNNDQFNLVIADPPYSQVVSRKSTYWSNKRFKSVDAEWDKIDNYQYFTEQWLIKLKQHLTSKSSIFIYSGKTSLGTILTSLEKTGYYIINLIVWNKHDAFPNTFNHTRFPEATEFIVFARPNKTHYFNKEMIDFEKRNIWKEGVPKGLIRCHPTQKPPNISRLLIESASNPGDLVLDLFAGSGIVSLIGSALNRHCVYVERDVETYNNSLIHGSNIDPIKKLLFEKKTISFVEENSILMYVQNLDKELEESQ